MPRNIPTEALVKLAQTKGLEPVNIIRIQWVDGGGYMYYSDRALPEYPYIQGKLISQDDLEAVLNIDKSGTSTSVKITLDDTDGTIKEIFNFNDINNRPVVVFQWFYDSSFSMNYAFQIFSGAIATPIEWSEGDLKISFDVLTKLEDRECGFTVEDGDFTNVPAVLLGKTWPTVFGTVLDMPTVQMDEIPTGTTREPMSIPDWNIFQQINHFDCNRSNQAAKAFCLEDRAFQLFSQAGTFTDNGSPETERAVQLQCQSQQILKGLNSGNNFNQQVQLLQTFAQQKLYYKDSVEVIGGGKFIQGTRIKIMINSAEFTGYFSGTTFNIESRRSPADIERDNGGIKPWVPPQQAGRGVVIDLSQCGGERWSNESYWACDPPWVAVSNCSQQAPAANKGQAWFAQSGASVNVGDNYPIRFILSIVPGTIVVYLSAYKSVDGIKILTPIPPEYYQLGTISLGTVTALIATFTQPLTTRKDELWDSDVYATLTSPVGPNVVDILVYLISLYTENTIDSVSFTHVRGLLINYPANFALLGKKNVVEVLQEIAYQSRCAIWIADDVFYIKYLPEQGDSIDTITEDDIEQQTLVITTTPTEDLVTKYVASWKASYAQKADDKIILTYNINKYGVKEKDYDYYIYNTVELVEKSAVYWLIKTANMFKVVQCKTFLTKLKLETMDNCTVDLAHHSHALVPVVGVVQKATYNSQDYSIDMEIWIPVRIGEMYPYIFAYPAGISIQYLFPTVEDIAGGFVNDVPQAKGATGNLSGRQTTSQGGSKKQHKVSDQGDNQDNLPKITTLDPYANTNTRPATPAQVPTNNYQILPFEDPNVRVGSNRGGDGGGGIPCYIGEQVDPVTYEATIYANGIEGDGEEVQVVILQINADDVIPEGTAGLATKLTIKNDAGESETVYYFQPAVYTGVTPSEAE